MDEAERCSRVALMYQGQIIVCDVPEEIKGLVAGDLLEVRSLDLRTAEDLVADLEGVLEVQTYGDLLHVFVDRADERQDQMRKALEAQGVELTGLRQIRPRMEEAFISLVRRQMTETAAGKTGEGDAEQPEVAGEQ
jgi:ABC-2 type transport system ATP-binding protein